MPSIINEQHEQPITVDGRLTRMNTIKILKPIYPLDENDFNILVRGNSGFKEWAKNLGFATLGWSIKLISVFMVFIMAITVATDKNNVVLQFEKWEFIAIIISLIIIGVLYLLGTKVKSNKDKLIGKIKNHYSVNNNDNLTLIN